MAETGHDDRRAVIDMELDDDLSREHGLILGVLDALESWLAAVLRLGIDARAELGRFLVFFHRFVDGIHCAKQEQVIFRALLGNDVPPFRQLIRRLLHEHEHGRDLLGPLEDLGYRPSPWTTDDRSALDRAIASYVAQQREHVAREARELLPLLRARFADAPEPAALPELAHFAAGHAETSARLRDLAETLIAAHCLQCRHVWRAPRN